MENDELRSRLDGGLFISSMMGITDGVWVAERAAGTRMVQIGALIADTLSREHPAKSLLPTDEGEMAAALHTHVETIRMEWGDLPIGLNAAPGELESAVKMARAFQEAGGDIFELNCHGGYSKLLERGLLRAMMEPEQRSELRDWIRELSALPFPFVVKFNGTVDGIDFVELLESIEDIKGVFGIHFNIRDNAAKAPNLDLVRTVRPLVAGVLFCSGYVTTRKGFEDVLQAGADCVGVSQGMLDDPGIVDLIT
jgi:tRNA-dihydrouridine synthase